MKSKLSILNFKKERAIAKLNMVNIEIAQEISIQLKKWNGTFMNKDWQKINVNRDFDRSFVDETYYFLNERNKDNIILTDFVNEYKIMVRKAFWEKLSAKQKHMLENEIKAKYPHMKEIIIQSHYIGW